MLWAVVVAEIISSRPCSDVLTKGLSLFLSRTPVKSLPKKSKLLPHFHPDISAVDISCVYKAKCIEELESPAAQPLVSLSIAKKKKNQITTDRFYPDIYLGFFE